MGKQAPFSPGLLLAWNPRPLPDALHHVLGGWDADALPELNFQDMLGESCRSHAALLATMAPEGNLEVRFLPRGTLLLCHGLLHLHENLEKHRIDERPGDGGASSLAKYRGRII